MKIPTLIALGLAVAFVLTQFQFVRDTPEDELEIAADSSGDDARTELRIEDTLDSQLLPHIQENAVDVTELQTAIAGGLEAAGELYANRGAGEGAAWNFPVSGEGVVVEAKLDTRARWVGLDTNSDGTSDLTLQLGPVIKGNALRDVAPFYNFDDFRDQIEFAKLGRAINNAISPRLVVSQEDTIGLTFRFIGVVPLKSADEAWTVTPTIVEVIE